MDLAGRSATLGIALLLFASSAPGDSCKLLSGSGSLSTSSWSCGHVPGDGDTAVISTGSTVIIDQDWTIGMSGANNSTPAIYLAGNASFTQNAGTTLRLRGDLLFDGTRQWSEPAGTFNGSVIFDSSQAADPTSTWYRIGGDHALGGFPRGGLWSGSNCTFSVDKTNGSLGGGFSFEDVPWARGGNWGDELSFSNCAFTDLTGIEIGISTFHMVNNTFTNIARGVFSGQYGITATGDFTVIGNRWTQPSGSRYSFAPLLTSRLDSGGNGTRQFHDNVIEAGTFGDRGSNCQYTSQVNDLTMYNNYFGGGSCAFGTVPQFSGNFLKSSVNSWAAPGLTVGYLLGFAPSYNYVFVDMTNTDNPHATFAGQAGQVATHIIFESPDDPSSDSGEAYLAGANAQAIATITLRNSIVLPSKTGRGTMEITAVLAGNTSSNYRFIFEHNTWFGGVAKFGPAWGFGGIQLEDGSGVAGQLISFKSNLFASMGTSVQPAFKLASGNHSARIQDICAPADCDYNAGFNIASVDPNCAGCANQGDGYAGKWSATPGAHDLDGQDPQFLDPYRSVALWDTRYLGNSYSPWDSSVNYALGSLVQHHHAGYWNDSQIGFRCINPNGCAGNDATKEPNNGRNWRADWEFSSLYQIREAILAGATFWDDTIGCAGCSPVEALVRWVAQGSVPQNPSYCGAGHDAAAIGAVDCR